MDKVRSCCVESTEEKAGKPNFKQRCGDRYSFGVTKSRVHMLRYLARLAMVDLHLLPRRSHALLHDTSTNTKPQITSSTSPADWVPALYTPASSSTLPLMLRRELCRQQLGLSKCRCETKKRSHSRVVMEEIPMAATRPQLRL
jgi:hypothetical protein